MEHRQESFAEALRRLTGGRRLFVDVHLPRLVLRILFTICAFPRAPKVHLLQ